MDGWTDQWMNGQINEWMDRSMDGWTDQWMDGQINGWMDK